MEYNNEPYGNYKMLSITGEFLAFTSKKRMDWYVSRELADKVDDYAYQLNFISGGGGNGVRGDFHKLPLKNKCVVCGTEEELTKHHIVPSQYRKLLPIKYKGRNSFDVVIICNMCHNEYEREADKLKDSLLVKYGLTTYVKDNIKIKRYHNTLKCFSDSMPWERQNKLSEFLIDKLGDTLDNILLIDEFEFPSVSEKVMSNINDIEGFIIMWRKHFLDISKPQFISEEWVSEVEIIF